MQKKSFQSLFALLFIAGCVCFSGCKKVTEDIQIACVLTLLKADAAVINSTLSPAKTGVGVQLVVFRNDTLVDKINRTHNGNNDFNLSSLKPNTAYRVEMSIINNPNLIAEVCVVTFTTLLSNTPIVVTSAVANITPSGADVGGNVTTEGLSSVTESGVCWSLTTNPTISGSHTALSSGLGSFSTTLTTLTASTKYYVRAYARTATTTVYGGNVSFTTLPVVPQPPTVVTKPDSAVTQTGVSTGGHITSAGTAPVTVKGICYGTTVDPNTSGPKTTNGSGTASFNVNLSTLTPSTTYYVRAYATNSVGTSYGDNVVFTTLAIVAPTVATTVPSSITQTTAIAGGNVSSDGGAVVTALGVCYGTSPNPDLTGSFTNNGSGTGNYSSPLTGLTPGTFYHVRAYATNSVGTSYGADATFTTAP